ncbi:hypothetical protein [Pseudonocardia parietis]|uniref:Uncharacterized protein n=1 Tax=Pseudonocardia parietis TaxID=570936 RepID=A0ABS4W416_9PSEU|nr:hypothetical protein [Pseudonocardia parietis]MBP2370673.1 hypothetical protein [Pseudonocardia parietis]
MASIPTRRSYEAAVLLVALDPTARLWLNGHDDSELAGITIAGAELAAPPPDDPAPGAGGPPAVSSPLEHAVHATDVVVVLTHDLAGVDRDMVIRIGDAARANGILLGAVIASPGARWDDPAAERSATTVREAADSVVVLDDTRFTLPFLQVLRGGARDGDLAGAPS